MESKLRVLELFGGLKIKVSSDGDIYTLDHTEIRANGKIDNRKGKKIKPSLDRYGYRRATFSYRGERHSYTIHRLVALAFLPNPENKPTVNHKDGVKTNNCVENLEWAIAKKGVFVC